MLRQLIIIQIICTILLINSAHAKLKFECVVDFLKFRHVADDTFENVETYSGNPTECSDGVRDKIQTFYAAVRSKLEANIRQKPYTDCVMKEIESEQYENLLLKATAIDLKGVGLKFWKVSKKNARIKDLEEKAQEIVDGALIKCKGNVDYGAFFDSFYEQKRGEQFNDEFDYCLRKYLVDKNLINANQNNFKVNPKNIQTNSIGCDDMMKIALDQLKEQVSSAGSNCVIDKFIANGYLDMILKIQLLTKLNLTPSEKAIEKQVFITQMINMTHAIKSCPI